MGLALADLFCLLDSKIQLRYPERVKTSLSINIHLTECKNLNFGASLKQLQPINDIPQDLSGRIIRSGSALMTARLISRVFQLIRMITIARWLGPEEMGVYEGAG